VKILFIVHGYPPHEIGGVEIYTRDIARTLAAAGHEVEILAPRQVGKAEPPGTVERAADDAGVRVTLVAANRRRPGATDRALLGALAALLERFRPEVAHLQHLYRFPLAAFDAIAARGVAIVAHLHDYWWMCPRVKLVDRESRVCAGPGGLKCTLCLHGRAAGLARAPIAAWAYRARPGRLRGLLLRARAVVAPSEDVRARYAAFGVPAERVTVLPYGVALPPIEPRAGRATPGRVTFGYLGAVFPEKGVDVLLAALARVKSPAALEIFGDGPRRYMAGLRAAAAACPHPVAFRGRYAREALFSEVLPRLDAVCLPSVWPETYGIVLDEALHARLPVVLSAIGGMAERFRDGQNGFVVPPGDAAALARALETLASDYERVRAALRYDPPSPGLDAHVASLVALYGRALAAERRGEP
jgi:glycosyltransferase involved in cell wall biosynthesis